MQVTQKAKNGTTISSDTMPGYFYEGMIVRIK
jgi:hypothetical protein